MKLFLFTAVFVLGLVAEAAPTIYEFRCYPNETGLEKVSLKLQGNSAYLNGEKGRLDKTYSGGLAKSYDRFVGYAPVDGSIELLVQKALRKGADNGQIRIQVRGEGFSSDKYTCYSRD